MLIKVTNLETGQYIKTVDYTQLLEICAGDTKMADDFIRMIKHHPDSQKVQERWEIVEE